MKTTTTFAFFAASLMLAICFAPAAQADTVTFDWATVGNPGNADDTHDHTHDDGFGGVDYSYRISKTEVTNAQYTEFLNAVADEDPNELYSTIMGSSSRGGITRSGTSPSFTYAVKVDSAGNGPGGTDYTYSNKPVVFVSFFDAMRFTNWLENGQPTGAQSAGTTEAGVYNISSGTDEVRNPSATYFIPSEDEWYKAAYYDPNSGGGIYYDYPTSTDTPPDSNLPSADTGNSANYAVGSVTGGNAYPMTDVGAYTASESPYGTFDQGGNVWEWNEAVIGFFHFSRGRRGGGWFGPHFNLSASTWGFDNPSDENNKFGFRIASIPVPEPSTLLLGALASMGLLIRRRRLG